MQCFKGTERKRKQVHADEGCYWLSVFDIELNYRSFFFLLFVAFMSHYLSVDLFSRHQYGHSFYIGI